MEFFRRTETFKKKGYVITRDNFLKILMICQRAQLGLPIIIQGETGCGKTYMINFISTCLLQDEFRCLTLHAGVTETELIKRLQEYFKLANELKEDSESSRNQKERWNEGFDRGRWLWILMDEFNTSPLQSLLTEIMVERKASFTDQLPTIPENIVFVGCCNPYRVKLSKGGNEADDPQVGLVQQSRRVDLSHRVFKVPSSLLNYVWDFGQVSYEDEMKYIEAIINLADFENKDSDGAGKGKGVINWRQNSIWMPNLYSKKAKNYIPVVISICQKFIREEEGESSVSLRDVERFLRVYQYIRQLKEDQLVAIALSAGINYFLRIGSKSGRLELNELLNRAINARLLLRDLAGFLKTHIKGKNSKRGSGSSTDSDRKNEPKSSHKINFIDVLSHFSQRIGKEVQNSKKIPNIEKDGIAFNRALNENLLALFISIELGIPLMICGKPGTSKTLSVKMVEEILYDKKSVASDSKILKILTACEFERFWGTLNTTSDSIIKAFKALHKKIEKNKNSKFGMIFDEIGLAEIAPENPLKVLHPILDPPRDSESSESAELQISTPFVGISNWKLDASKMNRVLFVARADMDPEDLLETCRCRLRSFFEKNEKFCKEAKIDLDAKKGSNGVREGVIGVIDVFFMHISDAYYSFRKNECSEDKTIQPNFHGSRDFYSLIWDVVTNLKGHKIAPILLKTRSESEKLKKFEIALEEICFKSINKNFSGRMLNNNLSSSVMKECFLKQKYPRKSDSEKLIKNLKKLENRLSYNSLREIWANINSEHSRYLLVFTEMAYYKRIVIEMIEKTKRLSKTKKLKLVRFSQCRDDKEVHEVLSKLPHYIKEGYTVIMENMDRIYGCLYELLNKKFRVIRDPKTKKKRYYCYLLYNERRLGGRIEVNPDFRCVMFMKRQDVVQLGDDFWRQPPPFLNRFEKHLVRIQDIFRPEEEKDYKKVLDDLGLVFGDTKGRGGQSEGNQPDPAIAPYLMIHNYSEELILTLILSVEKSLNKTSKTLEYQAQDSQSYQASLLDDLSSSEESEETNFRQPQRMSTLDIQRRLKSFFRYIQASEGQNSEELEMVYALELLPLCSKNFLIFMLKLQEKQPQRERDEFMLGYQKCHPIQSLETLLGGFLDRFGERGSKSLRAAEEGERADRAIIFTFTQSYYLRKVIRTVIGEDFEENIDLKNVHEIVDNENSEVDETIRVLLATQKEVLIVQFAQRSDWKLIENLKKKIDENFENRLKNMPKNKKVLFVAHYAAQDYQETVFEQISTDINFMSENWGMVAIDNLEGPEEGGIMYELIDKSVYHLSKRPNFRFFKKLILGRLAVLYARHIDNERKRVLYHELMQLLNSHDKSITQIFEILIKKISDFISKEKYKEAPQRLEDPLNEAIYSDKIRIHKDKEKIYELILTKNLIREFSIDDLETICGIFTSIQGDYIDQVLIMIDQKQNFCDLLIYQNEGNRPDSELKNGLRDWKRSLKHINFDDSEFSESRKKFKRFLKSKDPKQQKKFQRAPEDLSPQFADDCLSPTPSRVSKGFSKSLETIFLENEEIRGKLCSGRSGAVGESIQSLSELMYGALHIKETYKLASSAEFEKFVKMEILRSVVTTTEPTFKELGYMQEKISELIDGLHLRPQTIKNREMKKFQNSPKEQQIWKTSEFVAFCLTFRPYIELLSLNLTQNGVSATKKLKILEVLKSELRHLNKPPKHINEMILKTLPSLASYHSLEGQEKKAKLLKIAKNSNSKQGHDKALDVSLELLIIIFVQKIEELKAGGRIRGVVGWSKLLKNLENRLTFATPQSTFEHKKGVKKASGEVLEAVIEWVSQNCDQFGADIVCSVLGVLASGHGHHTGFTHLKLPDDLKYRILRSVVYVVCPKVEKIDPKKETVLSKDSASVSHSDAHLATDTVLSLKYRGNGGSDTENQAEIRKKKFAKNHDLVASLAASIVFTSIDVDYRHLKPTLSTKISKELGELVDFNTVDESRLKFIMYLSDSFCAELAIQDGFNQLPRAPNQPKNREKGQNGSTTIDLLNHVFMDNKLSFDDLTSQKEGKFVFFVLYLSVVRFAMGDFKLKNSAKKINFLDQKIKEYYNSDAYRPLAVFLMQRLVAVLAKNHLKRLKDEFGLYEVFKIISGLREHQGGEEDSEGHRIASFVFSDPKVAEFVPELFKSLKNFENSIELDQPEKLLSIVMVYIYVVKEERDSDRRARKLELLVSDIKCRTPFVNFLNEARRLIEPNLRTGEPELRRLRHKEHLFSVILASGGVFEALKNSEILDKKIDYKWELDENELNKGLNRMKVYLKKPWEVEKSRKIDPISEEDSVTRGYQKTDIKPLGWLLDVYPWLGNMQNAIFGHMASEILVLFVELRKEKNSLESCLNLLKHIEYDLIELTEACGFDSVAETARLVNFLFGLLFEKVRSGRVWKLTSFLKNVSRRKMMNVRRTLTEFERDLTAEFSFEKNEKNGYFGFIDRTMGLDKLRRMLGAEKSSILRLFRNFSPFDNKIFVKMAEQDLPKNRLLVKILEHRELLWPFAMSLAPLVDLATHLSSNYSYLLTRKDTEIWKMSDFLRTSRDEKLYNLYNLALEVIKNGQKLKFVLKKLERLVEIEGGFKRIWSDLGKIEDNGGHLADFLVTKSPKHGDKKHSRNGDFGGHRSTKKDKKSVIQRVIEAFTNFQNAFLADFKEDHQKANDWALSAQIIAQPVQLIDLHPEDILSLESNLGTILKVFTPFRTELYQETQLEPDFGEIKQALDRRVLTNRRYIALHPSPPSFYKFRGSREANLGRLIGRYFHRQGIDLKVLGGYGKRREGSEGSGALGRAFFELELVEPIDDETMIDILEVDLLLVGLSKDKEDLVTLMKLEGLFCRLVEDLIRANYRDFGSSCAIDEEKREVYISLTASKGLFEYIIDEIPISYLRNFYYLLRVRKGKLFYEKVYESESHQKSYFVHLKGPLREKLTNGIWALVNERKDRPDGREGVESELLNQLYGGVNELAYGSDGESLNLEILEERLLEVVKPSMVPLVYQEGREGDRRGRRSDLGTVFDGMTKQEVWSLRVYNLLWIIMQVKKIEEEAQRRR